MKTYILMWNPAISSYKMEDFRKCLVHLNDYFWENENGETETLEMNWSVWEHEQAEDGDRFFMVRVGEGKTGIVMSGIFGSDPYEDEDWSGKGRKTFYMDLDCDTMVDTENAPYISTEELMERLPGFDWTGGHSGRLLDADLAEQLEVLWLEYLYKNYNIFDEKKANSTAPAEPCINDILVDYLVRTKGTVCEICGYDYHKLWGEDCHAENEFRLFEPSEEDRAKPDDCVWKHIHCLCPSCSIVHDEMLCERLGEHVWDMYID